MCTRPILFFGINYFLEKNALKLSTLFARISTGPITMPKRKSATGQPSSNGRGNEDSESDEVSAPTAVFHVNERANTVQDLEMLDVDFEWFDPQPEVDFHGLKTLCRQLFDIDAQLFDLSALVELILSQPLLGSTVKVDGNETDPYAFLTVLNLHVHKVRTPFRSTRISTKTLPRTSRSYKHWPRTWRNTQAAPSRISYHSSHQILQRKSALC